MIEKYTPKRINKDVSPNALSSSGDRLFLPGDMLDAENCVYDLDGMIRNIKGNSKKILTLPDGVNTVIGSFKFQKRGTIIYLIHNSNSSHQVIEYNPFLDTFRLIIGGSFLNFSRESYITQGGTIDDLFIWANKNNPAGKILVEGDYSTVTNIKQVSLYACPPVISPTVSKETDATKILNFLTRDNWQFRYNFIYKDNSESTWSPYSKLIEGRLDASTTIIVDNRILVSIEIDPLLLPFIQVVQFGVRKGNEGSLYVFEKVINPTLSSYSKYFYGNEVLIAVAPTDSARIQDDIPISPESLEIIDNRIFVPLTSVGFNIPTGFTFTAEAEEDGEANTTSSQFDSSKRYLKDGGSYSVGLIVLDDFNRASFVQQAVVIDVPVEDILQAPPEVGIGDYTHGVDSTKRKRIRWNLTGTFDSRFKKLQIVVTRNSGQLIYEQFKVIPLRYIRELKEGEDDNSTDFSEDATDNEFFLSYRGKVFMKRTIPINVNEGFVSSVYLQMPLNPPFIPSSGDIVRFLDFKAPDVSYELPVMSIVGDYIVVDRTALDLIIEWERYLFIEVYRPGQKDNEFFEISEIININNGTPEATTGLVNGDTYLALLYGYNGSFKSGFNFFIDTSNNPNSLLFPYDIGVPVIETPSNVVSTDGTTVITGGGTISLLSSENRRIRTLFSIDYNKIASDFGRPHTTNPLEKNESFPNTFGFSEEYVQDTRINGLSTFLANNKYTIAINRTRVNALKRAGNVLLAIHQNAVSSLYIGEGFIRQGQDFILAKTEGVVGDDRELNTRYGTINPESIIEVDGYVYFWDAYRGAVMRYTNAGLYPISRNLMNNYFRDKARQLFPYRDSVKVVMGYDYEHDFVLISFPDVYVGLSLVIPGVTWAFSAKSETWSVRFGFKPEMFGTLETHLLSFLNGELWVHNINPIHNNFYGVQYARRLRYGVNKDVGKNKKLLNIHIDGDLADDPTSETIVARVYAQKNQESYIPVYEFEQEEGVLGKWAAAVLRNINSPVDAGLALRSGDELVSNSFEVEIINEMTTEAASNGINVVFKEEEFSV